MLPNNVGPLPEYNHHHRHQHPAHPDENHDGQARDGSKNRARDASYMNHPEEDSDSTIRPLFSFTNSGNAGTVVDRQITSDHAVVSMSQDLQSLRLAEEAHPNSSENIAASIATALQNLRLADEPYKQNNGGSPQSHRHQSHLLGTGTAPGQNYKPSESFQMDTMTISPHRGNSSASQNMVESGLNTQLTQQAQSQTPDFDSLDPSATYQTRPKHHSACKCNNCGRPGHRVASCVGPTHEGFLIGCPICDIGDFSARQGQGPPLHAYDDCPNRNEDDDYDVLILRRAGRAPIWCRRLDWVDVWLKENRQHVGVPLPLSLAVSRLIEAGRLPEKQRPTDWKTFDYADVMRPEKERSRLPIDGKLGLNPIPAKERAKRAQGLRGSVSAVQPRSRYWECELDEWDCSPWYRCASPERQRQPRSRRRSRSPPYWRSSPGYQRQPESRHRDHSTRYRSASPVRQRRELERHTLRQFNEETHDDGWDRTAEWLNLRNRGRSR